ncbi:MAG: RdgB/HAM1 family non-canonical purine NTP pyrophosphatase [Clostridia bacterium]|nr:RdgB/HAM1 family non-canonical purine NTP pyrophosphatase [Clostridia bacterium]
MRYVIATHNKDKLKELSRILEPLGIEAVTDRDLGLVLPEVEETGTTFAENAYLKAASACEFTGLPAIADDSGIAVDALNGGPGIYSARYGGPEATDKDRNAKLLGELEGIPAERRGAHYACAVCCVFPDGSEPLTAEGKLYGVIGTEERGERGFGYDPLFIVAPGIPGAGKTVAELSEEEKDAISHRGNALRVFREALQKRIG